MGEGEATGEWASWPRAGACGEGVLDPQDVSSSYCWLLPSDTAERGPSLWLPATAAESLFTSIRINPTQTRASLLSTCPMTPVTVSDFFGRRSLARGRDPDSLSMPPLLSVVLS